VLQLIDQLGDAGAEQLLYTFATGMDRDRFDLHVCALRPWSPPRIVPAIRALGFPVIEMDQHHAYDLHVIRDLVSYIRRERIDIIHTHLLAADIMGRIAGFITRRPVVSTIHNGRVDLDKEPLHRRLMERWSARLWCRRLIVVSTILRDEIAAWFGFRPGRVLAIPNGIDTSRFVPPPDFGAAAVKRDLLGGDYPMITNVARLTPQKAQRYLVEAAARIAPTHPDVRFVIVGDGELRDEIVDLVRAHDLSDRFIITGPRTDIPRILAASDVFVLSSLWEGMPLSLLEAMSACCPAVATDVGGVSEVLKDSVTGLLVPPADVDALTRAITDCLDNPRAARKRAAAAQSMVITRYDKTTMVRKWQAVYLHEVRRTR
jgi:glycosyltransferase involved in cell wall biosynthesis